MSLTMGSQGQAAPRAFYGVGDFAQALGIGEMSVPAVRAVIWPVRRDEFSSACGEVDRVAAAFDVEPKLSNGQYAMEAGFGPVDVGSLAISAEARAAHQALTSYADNVQPEPVVAEVAGGVR